MTLPARITRTHWARACQLAREGGRIRPTLAEIGAAYRSIQRAEFPPDPFEEGVWHE